MEGVESTDHVLLAQQIVSRLPDIQWGPTTLARAAWAQRFGASHTTLSINDPTPFQPGPTLGSGGLGVVVETTIEDIPVAWKRIYTRRLNDRYLNEIKVLKQMSAKRHHHVVDFIGSYVHRHKGLYELGILMRPVAQCDLSVFLHHFDLLVEWYQRDWSFHGWDMPGEPTEEERVAFDNLRSIVSNDELEQYPLSLLTMRDKLITASGDRLRKAFGCIAQAVKYIHDQSIRHKDIKPSQILISSDGLWLTDFGWSRDTSEMTNSATSGGDTISFRYHAPERAQMKECGRPEDIFALGCTYLEMVLCLESQNANEILNPDNKPTWSFQANLDFFETWVYPFKSENLDERQIIEELIRDMLARDPEDRPQIAEVVDILSVPALCAAGCSFLDRCCYGGKIIP